MITKYRKLEKTEQTNIRMPRFTEIKVTPHHHHEASDSYLYTGNPFLEKSFNRFIALYYTTTMIEVSMYI